MGRALIRFAFLRLLACVSMILPAYAGFEDQHLEQNKAQVLPVLWKNAG